MAEATRDSQFVGCPARRALLLSLTTAGITALAGCGDDSKKTSAPAAGAAEQPPPSPSTALSSAPTEVPAAPPPAAPPTKKGSSAPAASGLVQTTKVPVGGGVLASGLVVVQPQKGVFKAYDTTCPHQGVKVDAPEAGVITCPGHDSKFKVADGSRISGPAPRGLRTVAVKVQNGFVVRA